MTTSSTVLTKSRPPRFAPDGALTNEARAESIVQRHFGGHRMTVLHDDGLYRHLRFANPEFGEYWFELATWPGHLAITGDIGANVFARDTDMIAFFAGAARINPSYWSEKIVDSSPTKVHTELSVRRLLDDVIDALAAENDTLTAVGEEPRFDLDEWARTLDDDVLVFGDDAQGAQEAIRDLEVPSVVADVLDEPNTQEYDIQMLLRLHAIRIGVQMYIKHRAALEAELSQSN